MAPSPPKHSRAAPTRPASARAALLSKRAASPTEGTNSQVAEPPKQPDWMPTSLVGRDFGDPPTPLLKFLQHKQMAWEKEVPDTTILDVQRFRAMESVKLREGTIDARAPKGPRPRSALVLKVELANLKRDS